MFRDRLLEVADSFFSNPRKEPEALRMSLRALVRPARRWLAEKRLPEPARAALRRDRAGLPAADPGISASVEAAIAWLGCAQDRSSSQDGGVARHYSLIGGWSASYPETSGYIVPTLLDWARDEHDDDAAARAQRILDWLVSIQFPEGGFQGGVIGQTPRVSVTFNTGQILLGLAQGVAYFGEAYREPMCLAADWLASTIDDDGCWRSAPSPFAAPDDKVYDMHVAWGLLEASRQVPQSRWSDVALRNVHWALAKQRENGWFESCCLNDPAHPLTHTLGYALRGLLEAHRFDGGTELLEAARRTADGLLNSVGPDGTLAGRLHADWSPAVGWVCLTGSAQVAHCYLMLYEQTEDARYRDAGRRLNAFVRRTVCIDGPQGVRGGVRGSFPINGDYARFEYLNWAAKFFVDSNRLEARLCG